MSVFDLRILIYPFGIFKLFLFKLVIPIIVGTVVVVIVWYLGLQIPLIR